MITPDQARDRAERTYNGDKPADQRDEVGLYEFDDGYVAWRKAPPRDDPTRPPNPVGGGVIVIDKDTGEISDWPNLPADIIAERYRTRRGGAAGG